VSVCTLRALAIPKNVPHTACVIPRNWTASQIALRDCSNNSHVHISRDIIADAITLNIVEWVSMPRRSKGERGIARWLRQIPVRGMSCRLGMSFAGDIPEWAKVMLSNIRMEREGASTGHAIAERNVLDEIYGNASI